MLLTRHQEAADASTPGRRSRQRLLRPLLVGALILAMVVAGAIWFVVDPDALPGAVDAARAIFGPEAVAQVETAVFSAQDRLRQARYQATGAGAELHWAAAALPASRQAQPQPAASTATNVARTGVRAAPASQPSATALASAASAPGWEPYIVGADGTPLLERALVSPDPARP